jgi:hypothetical protein
MGAFKQFLSTDVTVVPFVVNKSFSFEGTASMEEAGIQLFRLKNVPYGSVNDSSASLNTSYSQSLMYNFIKQLYYTNYIPTPAQSEAPPLVYDYNGNVLEDYTTTATNARFYNYEQTTLFSTSSLTTYIPGFMYNRFLPTSSDVFRYGVSIPKNLFGDYINPTSFHLNIFSGLAKYDDTGEGYLYRSGSGSPPSEAAIITYSHGIVVGTFLSNFLAINNITCSFQSSRTIYETQFKCTIRPDEFNFSLNPSLISGSTDGTPYDFITGSYFAPYVTTVGLFNENQELLAVAKLAQPLPTSRTTDTTIVINLDM